MVCLFSIPETGRLKIGYSSKPDKRFFSLKTGTPLFLLGAYPGGYEEKERVKAEFHSFLVSHPNMAGEWYRDVPQIRAYFKRHSVIPPNALSSQEKLTKIFAEYTLHQLKDDQRRNRDLINRINLVTKNEPVLEYRLMRDITVLGIKPTDVFRVMKLIGIRETRIEDANLGSLRLFAAPPKKQRAYPRSFQITIGRYSTAIDLTTCKWNALTDKLRL